MSYIEDEYFARQLQNELQAYENFKKKKEDKEKENLNPIDSELEYIDPTPNIHDLFVKFDKKFFWNSLGMVQVVWSTRMTKCAGICSFEGGIGLCKIALSGPLLSLRPRKDLVETLLHEMIHAYLFVTHNNKDRDDHGPEFHKHMYRINKEAGTKISVYHTFFDEVQYYQRHIWRCNGPCQKQKPYFGFVRRAMNRAPGPHDSWWSRHKMECGGTFIKISEPEEKPKRSRKAVVKTGDKSKDIRNYFNKKTNSENKVGKQISSIVTFADLKNKGVTGMKINSGSATMVITNPKARDSNAKSPKSTNTNQPSVKDFINNSGGKSKEISPKLKNYVNNSKTKSNANDSDCDNVRETVRNVWANKFSDLASKTTKNEPNPKKIKLDCISCGESFSEVEIQSHKRNCVSLKVELIKEEPSCSGVGDNKIDNDGTEWKNCAICNKKVLESEMNDHLEGCLSCSFENEDEEFDCDVKCESVPCPCCYKWFQESEMNSHIDECLTLRSLKEEALLS